MIGYNEALSARTARKAHRCADGSGCTIRPGHRYVRWVAFPGHDAVTTNRPDVRKQCIAHAMQHVDEDDWWAMCRYTRDRALELAVAAVDTIRVNGWSVADVLNR